VNSNLIRVQPPAAGVRTLLCNVDVDAWDELDQRIVDTAVRQWRTRLRACVRALGGPFEHKL